MRRRISQAQEDLGIHYDSGVCAVGELDPWLAEELNAEVGAKRGTRNAERGTRAMRIMGSGVLSTLMWEGYFFCKECGRIKDVEVCEVSEWHKVEWIRGAGETGD